jgi:methylated-DNA-[protein]-cysteine S-methyltransferase
VWSQHGIAGVMLPDSQAHQTRARVVQRFPDAREATPPPDVQRAVEHITALLRGEASDLSFVALDLEGVPAFHRRVYRIARSIPPGSTRSYGEIASQLGEPHAARAVGQALGRNPFPLIVPCHRVLASHGRTGGFSAPGGASTKLQLLAIEGERLL